MNFMARGLVAIVLASSVSGCLLPFLPTPFPVADSSGPMRVEVINFADATDTATDSGRVDVQFRDIATRPDVVVLDVGADVPRDVQADVRPDVRPDVMPDAGDVSTTPTRAPYQLCTSAIDVCGAGSSCRLANTTAASGASPGEFCTAACSAPGECPADVSGFGTACVLTSGGGQCYRTCGTGNTCPPGFVCGGPAGMAVYCIPSGGSSCGHIGERCCSGSTCADLGSACGTDGTCGRTPYFGCPASELGRACVAGFTVSGDSVATTCQQPSIATPGPDGYCSRRCTAVAECPTSPFGGRTVGCHAFSGGGGGQCFIHCGVGEVCPAGTACTAIATSDAGSVSVCAPMRP